jgi:DNA-binding transcriptional LysR family regulator
VVASFRAQRPNVRLRIGSYPATEIAHRIRRETADLGITFLPINDADLSVEPLLRTALTCLVSTASPLAREPVITPDHLKDECVIAQGSETPPGFVLHNYLERANLTGWPTVEVNQSTISLALAERQIGIAISHPLVLSTVSTGTVTAVPFEPQIPLTLALIYPREHERSKQVTEFVAILRQKLSEILTELKARRLPSELL